MVKKIITYENEVYVSKYNNKIICKYKKERLTILNKITSFLSLIKSSSSYFWIKECYGGNGG